jgi:nitroreductase
MDTMETIRQRRSVRSYDGREVEDEKLQQVLEAARLAPSAGNRQEWKFVVVRDAGLREQLVAAARGQEFVGQAPVVIAACAADTEHVMTCGFASYVVDLSIAIDHMTLAARDLGLGTCWIGAFEQDKVRAILDIPASVQIVGLLPMGYPTEWPPARDRRALEDIACYDKWAD